MTPCCSSTLPVQLDVLARSLVSGRLRLLAPGGRGAFLPLSTAVLPCGRVALRLLGCEPLRLSRLLGRHARGLLLLGLDPHQLRQLRLFSGKRLGDVGKLLVVGAESRCLAPGLAHRAHVPEQQQPQVGVGHLGLELGRVGRRLVRAPNTLPHLRVALLRRVIRRKLIEERRREVLIRALPVRHGRLRLAQQVEHRLERVECALWHGRRVAQCRERRARHTAQRVDDGAERARCEACSLFARSARRCVARLLLAHALDLLGQCRDRVWRRTAALLAALLAALRRCRILVLGRRLRRGLGLGSVAVCGWRVALLALHGLGRRWVVDGHDLGIQIGEDLLRALALHQCFVLRCLRLIRTA
mmetsp:Transcript_34733/g.103037  ORF Transcript_34733/g.103037 Transcript_34733/m.103037 type:complete len:358 (+) Transcript_34733:615-1688(+)|eukprot:361689-Chlamydomonas_euryale.AAC.14